MNLTGFTPSNPQKIELTGQFGYFSLPENPDSVSVSFFSTIASNREANSKKLLHELKPLREIVPAAELDNLDSILQRDLDDYRIANSLIPYISGQSTNIAFFPSVLAVLIPKGYLNKNGSQKTYPKNSAAGDPGLSKYGDLWETKKFKADDQILDLGQMTIHLDKTDIIVIDGQHRSNAFRYISGEFGNDDIYAAFYKNIHKPSSFFSDLPVTLIWFDPKNSANTINPTLVARKLFVDVNNSAKTVNESRTILLDDYELSSLLTKFFYNYIAENHDDRFSTSHFSLIHSGFDLNTDLDSAFNNPLILTNPQIVYHFTSWFFLGTRASLSDPAKYTTSNERKYKTQVQHFETYLNFDSFELKSLWDDDTEKYVISDINKKEDFYQEYKNSGIASSFYRLFNEFELYKIHILVTSEIEAWYKDGMNTTQKKVWEKVFKGGEGLFYTFDSVAKKFQNDEFKTYLQAIHEIKKVFIEKLEAKFSGIASQDVQKAYDTLRTKAFQTGFFMTVAYLKDAYELETVTEAVDLLLTSINQIPKEGLINILVRFKSQIPDIKESDPKKWPGFTKLILRSVQDYTDDLVVYDEENFFDAPEGKIFKKRVEDKVKAYIETYEDINGITDIDEADLKSWITEAKNEVKEIINLCSLHEIEVKQKDLIAITKEFISKAVFKTTL